MIVEMEEGRAMGILIADAERITRLRLRGEIERRGGERLVVECGDGLSAVEIIQHQRPTLVFLGVQLPGLDGFQVMERIGAARMPPTVVVTEYDEYVLAPLDSTGVEYLLKPLDADRVRDIVEATMRMISRGSRVEPPHTLARLLRHLRETPVSPTAFGPNRLPVGERGHIVFVRPDAIQWIESAGNYAHLHVGTKTFTRRQSLDGLRRRLGARFIRVRRSVLVNADAIATIHPVGNESFALGLRDGHVVRSSRRYRAELDGLQDMAG